MDKKCRQQFHFRKNIIIHWVERDKSEFRGRLETMQAQRFKERDWTLFKNKITNWQESYMDRLNKEYIELLSEDANPSEKFWRLDKRIKEDRKKTGV